MNDLTPPDRDDFESGRSGDRKFRKAYKRYTKAMSRASKDARRAANAAARNNPDAIAARGQNFQAAMSGAVSGAQSLVQGAAEMGLIGGPVAETVTVSGAESTSARPDEESSLSDFVADNAVVIGGGAIATALALAYALTRG